MAKTNSLRSQFKASSIKSLKKAVEKDDAMIGVVNNDYLNLEDGKTLKIRIFPAHPGQENFYVARKCYWLSFVTEEGETRRGTVLDSIAHGGTKMDLVNEYVKFAKKKYGNDSEKMELLVGTGMNSNSLNPQYSWLCYADVVRDGQELKPKIWEFKKMVRDLLNKLAFSEDEDEPIEVDPFTDCDEGLPVLVKYLKNPNKKKGEQYYEVNFAKKPVARPLTDEELEHFTNVKPLSEIIPRYSIRDFDRAMEGLQNFDEENEFDIFSDDDWLEIVEKVKAQYDGNSEDEDDEDEKPKKKAAKKVAKKVEEPEDDDDDTDDEEEEKPAPKKTAKKAAPAKKVEEPEEEEDEDTDDDSGSDDNESDEFDDMSRNELKKYIKENDLGVTVKKSMSDDDLRESIREALNNSEDEDEDTDEDEDEEEAEEKAPAKVTLDDIRAKLAKK